MALETNTTTKYTASCEDCPWNSREPGSISLARDHAEENDHSVFTSTIIQTVYRLTD